MCIYKLHVCPYPHQDPVVALVFEPSKLDGWQPCDLPCPWGRLSCGDLSVHHASLTPATSIISPLIPVHNESIDNKTATKNTSMVVPNGSKTSSTSDPAGTERCCWCTLILKMHAHKFKSIQNEAKEALGQMELVMDGNRNLRKMDAAIMAEEDRLDKLRQAAWELRESLIRKDTEETRQ